MRIPKIFLADTFCFCASCCAIWSMTAQKTTGENTF